jgi:hypothetical protein
MKVLILALIPLILSIGIAPVLSLAYVADSPKQQMATGLALNQISCDSDKILMVSVTGKPGCVFESHVEDFVKYGWGEVVEDHMPIEIPDLVEEIEETIDVEDDVSEGEESDTGKDIVVELEESVGIKGN